MLWLRLCLDKETNVVSDDLWNWTNKKPVFAGRYEV